MPVLRLKFLEDCEERLRSVASTARCLRTLEKLMDKTCCRRRRLGFAGSLENQLQILLLQIDLGACREM